MAIEGGQMRIIATVEGSLQLTADEHSLRLAAGQFCLLPASVPHAMIANSAPASLLDVTL
jgi:quercetin dioxygenase-like cupin family protein